MYIVRRPLVKFEAHRPQCMSSALHVSSSFRHLQYSTPLNLFPLCINLLPPCLPPPNPVYNRRTPTKTAPRTKLKELLSVTRRQNQRVLVIALKPPRDLVKVLLEGRGSWWRAQRRGSTFDHVDLFVSGGFSGMFKGEGEREGEGGGESEGPQGLRRRRRRRR